ncbi:MAG: hypothetical protein WC900_08645 [Oscillospiraceae bacterium]
MENYSYSKKPKKKPSCLPNGKSLNILAAATANMLSENFTCDELDVLAIYFRVLSESLLLIVSTDCINNAGSAAVDDIFL